MIIHPPSGDSSPVKAFGTEYLRDVPFDQGMVTGPDRPQHGKRRLYTCHNGSIAPGKPANHIPAPDTCESCHTTRAFLPAVMDHSIVSSSCFTCHNGTTVPGKPANHITSLNTCESCHTSTASWASVTINHDAVIGTCFSCHNGVIAIGQPADHPAGTGTQCENCHNTTSFVQ